MNTDQKAEKGNVARIVDRLSKDFGGSVGNAGSGTGKTENVPLRNRVVGVGANIGWVDPTAQSAITKDTAAIVRFSYSAQQPDELDLKEGDELLVLDMVEDGWAKGEILNSPSHPGRKGRIGLYPTNFVSTISPTPITQTPPINSVVSSSGLTSAFPRTIETNQNQENIVGGIPLSKSFPKSSNVQSTNQQQNIPERRMPLSNQNKPKELAKVLYKYDSANSDELSLPEGAIVTVVSRQCEDEGWFLAEIDGCRGLFPDNFVKFIPDEAIPPLHTTSSGNQAPPPLLPAKPQKFVGTLNMNPPPVASTRDSLSALNHSSANSPDVPTPPENQPNLMSMSMTTTNTVASDIENNNGGSNSSSNAGNKLSTGGLNSAGNRKSVNIQALQKAIFPTGQIPMQPPKKPPNSNIGTTTSIPIMQLNEEPKMKDFNSKSPDGSTKLLDKSIVKSRTKIAPTNKRPPSKVNSAAILVDNINNNDNDNEPSKILANSSSSLPIPANNSTHANSHSHQFSPSSPSQTTTPLTPDTPPALNIPFEGNKSATSFSSQPPPPSPNANHQPLHCSIEEELHHHQSVGHISTTHSSQQHKSTPFFQQPSLFSATSTTTASFHQPKAPPSPSSSSIASGKTDQTFEGGGSISTGLPPSSASSTQWVSRAEFDRLAEDYQRKFAEMRDELKELRGRVDLALNKMHNVLRKMAVRHCPLTKSTSTIISSSFKINKSMLSSTRRSSSIYSNNNNFRESSNIFESIGSAGGRRRNYSGFTNASFSYTASPHPPNSISRSSSPALSNTDFQAQNPS